MHALVIHGGAGVIAHKLVEGRRAQYEASLARILDGGFAILASGGSSLDAVTEAVRRLEDDPLFNAAHGAGLARDGSAELDAAIMDGRNCKAGAVAAVKHVRNPVELARCVMEKSRHLLLVGAGAEEFAMEEGTQLVPNSYFRTEARSQELDKEIRGEGEPQLMPSSQGTVGAVALDAHGDLAAATSTGGLTGKLPGRVGDSAIIGAGTYARNGVCAVSATGQGEYFIRAVGGYHIAAAVQYRRLSVEEAARELIHQVLPRLGGLGGVIAIDSEGRIAMDFNTQGMFRAARSSTGLREIAITRQG